MNQFNSSSTRRGRSALCALACSITILLSPAGALAGETMGTAKEGGLGGAAAITSLIYGPVKILYAVGGATIAGFAWVFSGGDSQVAGTVLTRAVRGTYVITPESLTGKSEIEFVGRAPEYRESGDRTQVARAPEVQDDLPDGW
jgi:type IV secretory pathway VirB2 component (pilin)